MIYQHYLFKKIINSFAGVMAILVLLIWFSRAVPFVGYITENGIKLSQFFYLFLLILPWLLLIIIPVSLLVAIVVSYNRLIANNEITILKNSGLTKFQIARPAFLLGFILSLICLFVSAYLMPYANRELRISKADIGNNYASLAFNSQTFETLKNITIYTKSRNENNELAEILLHDERSKDYSLTITAKSGKIIIEDNRAFLYMEDGSIQKFNNKDGKSEILYFDNYVFNLNEDRENFENFDWKPNQLYLSDLFKQKTELSGAKLRKYNAEIHKRLTYPFLSMLFSLIAMAAMLQGQFRRSGNLVNIIAAGVICGIFATISIMLYDFIENSPKLVFALYFNFIFFAAVSLKMLAANYRKKS